MNLKSITSLLLLVCLAGYAMGQDSTDDRLHSPFVLGTNAFSALSTTGINAFYLYNSKEDISVSLEDGRLVVTHRRTTPSNITLPTIPPQHVPDKVEIWRDIYGVRDGKIVLEKTERATYTPPKTETTPEKVEWPK